MSEAPSLKNSKNRIGKFNDLAPCGVFCGACPSFKKTCHGCASDDKAQPGKSKWVCKIRVCCYSQKKFVFCVECNEFPCYIFNKKLLSKHFGGPRFTYRYEIPVVFKKLKEMELLDYHEFQVQRWKCKCGGTIKFYDYKCNKCHTERLIAHY